jgi:hypothetical protein
MEEFAQGGCRKTICDGEKADRLSGLSRSCFHSVREVQADQADKLALQLPAVAR